MKFGISYNYRYQLAAVINMLSVFGKYSSTCQNTRVTKYSVSAALVMTASPLVREINVIKPIEPRYALASPSWRAPRNCPQPVWGCDAIFGTFRVIHVPPLCERRAKACDTLIITVVVIYVTFTTTRRKPRSTKKQTWIWNCKQVTAVGISAMVEYFSDRTRRWPCSFDIISHPASL